MFAEPQKHKIKSYIYDIFVRTTLGRYLPECLREVAERRPADPIEFIAQWLYNVYDSHIYFKQKLKYLRELCEADEIHRREAKEHSDKLKPFAEEMKAEKWKYYVSLTEELEALEGYINNVDVAVDEKSRQRFLEVQRLIHEEEVNLRNREESIQSSTTTPKNTRSEKSVPTVDSPLARSPRHAVTRQLPDSTKETTSVVKFQSNASLKKAKKPAERTQSVQSASRQRLIRDPGNRARIHSKYRTADQSSKVHPRIATTAVGKSSPSDISEGVQKDSDNSMISTMSKDESICHSFASQSTELGSKQRPKHTEKDQLAKSNFFRYVLDEHDSESGSCSVGQGGKYSSDYTADSDMDQLVAESESRDCRKVAKKRRERLEYPARTGQPRRDQTTTSQVKRRSDEGVLVSDGEDDRSHKSGIDGQHLDDCSCSTSTYTTSASFAGYTKLPRLSSKGEIMQQTVAASGVGRLKQSLLAEKDGTEYLADEEEFEEETGKERFTSSFVKQRYTSERFRLPPLGPQTDTTSSEVKSSGRGERHVSELSLESSDRHLQLPAVPVTSRITGTLVLTNAGHIAYVSKELGVIASNSLKIRNVHPIDKPEMWELRNFQCQSFYDHELYSQNLFHALDSDDDDHRYKDIPRMTMEDLTGPPHHRWNLTGEKRPP